MNLLHFAPVVTTSFLASSVEAVEAMTVVLAAGITRGWKSTLAGAACGLATLAAIVALLGPALAAAPLEALQVVTGTLLLLFGIRWMRKAILRYAGVIAMRDEDALYARERTALQGDAAAGSRIDVVAALGVFKVVLLEGLEVVVIVIGVGAAGGLLIPASMGAIAACAAVVALGAILHRPLSRVPENALKLAVGTLVSAFGMFWFGEGVGIRWPHGEAALVMLVAVLLATAFAGTRLARWAARR
ncbi:MAG TPA: hypothetical protein VFE23_07500 [Usitatibacter sp.]|jgi:uncharacterized membrane protein|nr:hypothetical protein [Usitatibacter sp.]